MSLARRLSVLVLAVLFVGAGVLHFATPAAYVAIMPPYVPAPLALVYLSGVFEVLGGLGLLVPRARRLAGWGLMALLVAVFPANLHMALHPDGFPGLAPALLYARLPLQAVLIAWVGWAVRPVTPPGAPR